MDNKPITDRLSLILLILGIYFSVIGVLLNIPFGQELLLKLYFIPTPVTEPNFLGHYGVFFLVLGILSFQARKAKQWIVAGPLVLAVASACLIDAFFSLVHLKIFGTLPTISYLLAGGGMLLIGAILLFQYKVNNK